MTNLYAIGPVTGEPNDNRQAFREAFQRLDAAGFYVQMPHDYIPVGTPWPEAMAKSINVLTDADVDGGLLFDGIALLPGWEQSKGACLEKQVAEAIGLEAKTVDEWVEVANG